MNMKKLVLGVLAVLVVLVSVLGEVKYLKGKYDFHVCEYLIACDDNCSENGYFAIYTDQNHESYCVRMKDGNESMRDKKFLVVTAKGDNNNVRYYLGMNDHEHVSRDVYHLDRNFARDYDALLSLWTE